jgi:hypothetical protein
VGAFLLLEVIMDQATLNETGVNREVSGIVNTDSPIAPDASQTYHDLDDRSDPTESKVASSAADDKKASDEDKGKGNGEDKDERFDKHPRFQELNERVKNAEKALETEKLERAKLEGRLEGTVQKKVETPEALPFKDISSMTVEQLREWQDDDPKGYAENLKAQARHEAESAIRAETAARAARDNEQGNLKKTYETFETKHPDFKEMWESGKIIKFIESNPGHNPISAYHEMTEETKLADAIAKAKKETEEEVTKRILSKKKATVLSGGPAGAARTEEDPALQNTKTHGGRTAVLADRLAAMRRQGGR